MDDTEAFLFTLGQRLETGGVWRDADQVPAADTTLDALLANQENASVRLGGLAALLLGCAGDPRENLILVLRRGDFQTLRGDLVRLLDRHATERHVGAVIHLIRRGSMLDRRTLFQTLSRIGNKENTRVGTLVKRYLRYGDQHSRLLAVEAAGALGMTECNDLLLYLLQKERSDPIRLAVLRALAPWRQPGIVEALAFLRTHDPSAAVRAAAGEALAGAPRETPPA